MRYLRAGTADDAAVPFFPIGFPWRTLPLTVGTMAAGVLVLLRRPGVPVARAFFMCSAAFSIHWTFFFGGDHRVTYLWIGAYGLASTLMLPLILRAAWLLPERPPEREPWWPWVFAIMGPVATTAFLGVPLPPAIGFPALFVVNVGFIGALLYVLTRNYMRADTLGRRQQKWVLYGLYAGLIPVMAIDLVTLAVPSWWWLHEIGTATEMIIPICLFIAIVRFKFYDIDRLITATVSYGLLAVVLLAVIFGIVPTVAEAASRLVGVDRRVGTPILSAMSAVSLVFLYQSVRPLVERLLFRERFAVQVSARNLLAAISRLDGQRALLEQVATGLNEIFGSLGCIVYERTESEFLPTAHIAKRSKSERPPSLDVSSILVTAITAARGHLDVDDWRNQRGATSLDSAARTFLARLAPAVLLPIHAAEGLVGFVALGAKRSGDIYSPNDAALLDAVGDKITDRLRQLDDARRTAAGPILLPRKYEVLGEIGRGGMGHVYRVRHSTLRRVLALKLLSSEFAEDEEMVARFQREARIMATLRHPNIVPVLDVDETAGHHFFVMEYVEGRSLGQLLRERGPLPYADALAFTYQIGSALSCAHAHDPPVIHRDIKPANVLIDAETGRALVTDFGIAKIAGTQGTIETKAGLFIGTLKYCSPEQVRGDRTIDGRADVYALGMVLFEMVAGRHMFDGLDEREVVRRVTEDPTEYSLDLPVPESVRRIIARAVAKSVDVRYRHIDELLADVASLLGVTLPRDYDGPILTPLPRIVPDRLPKREAEIAVTVQTSQFADTAVITDASQTEMVRASSSSLFGIVLTVVALTLVGAALALSVAILR
ncbi:MAG: protein kinase [Candidatus Binatia bacterium]